MNLSFRLFALSAIPALFVTIAAEDGLSPDNQPTITEIVVDNADFATLEIAVVAAGLADALNDTDADLTVFAPDNDAFATLPEELLSTLLDPAFLPHLTDVLLFHVASGIIPSGAIPEGLTRVEMLNAEFTDVDRIDSTITVNPGGATVETPDVSASNGIIHVIDRVLTPSWIGKSIVDVAADASGDPFSTVLLLASTFPDIVEALDLNGPFTFFAPPNSVFTTIGNASPDLLVALGENPAMLRAILEAHVVPGVVTSDRIAEGSSTAESISGETLAIAKEDGTVTVNGIPVTAADILAENGVIHVIGGLIVPDTIDLNALVEPERIKDFGSTPRSSRIPLGLCEGDCDTDDDCLDGLVCYQRNRNMPIPGCKGAPNSNSDFCVVEVASKFLEIQDFGGNPPGSAFPLRTCQGDCDTDDDCMDSLVCFQRGRNDPIPGCDGTSGARTDFCVSPFLA